MLGGAQADVWLKPLIESSIQQPLPRDSAYTALAEGKLPSKAELIEGSVSLLQADVTSQPLADLASDSARAEWVQDGLLLHEHESTCLFCGNEISSERRQALAAHFDRSMTDLQGRIDAQLALLERALDGADTMNASIPR